MIHKPSHYIVIIFFVAINARPFIYLEIMNHMSLLTLPNDHDQSYEEGKAC